jgi:hypothetical protein
VTELTSHIAEMEHQILWLVPEPGQQLEQFATMIVERLQDLQEG